VKDAANREPHYPEYETDSAHIFLIHCFPRVKLRRFSVHRCRYEIVNACSNRNNGTVGLMFICC
jgi:hypothetical protein